MRAGHVSHLPCCLPPYHLSCCQAEIQMRHDCEIKIQALRKKEAAFKAERALLKERLGRLLLRQPYTLCFSPLTPRRAFYRGGAKVRNVPGQGGGCLG